MFNKTMHDCKVYELKVLVAKRNHGSKMSEEFSIYFVSKAKFPWVSILQEKSHLLTYPL